MLKWLTETIMYSRNDIFRRYFTRLILCVMAFCGILYFGAARALAAASKDKFVVILDPGHGGHDHGACDNKAKEKNINLAVALKVGELCRKKLKDTDVVFTRDDDTFVSLQGRADIANKAKGDLFVSIHTNSVDAKNKNRRSVAGASVYTQGPHKDDANLGVARRENSVIELENGYQQKYSGFDPLKDESYIIFEMAQKKNLSESHRFAKSVQDNLVKIAGRKDRGVHQAGFWVLWSTSMPSVLVELDFICNPESANFMTSKDGVDKLAEAIFQAIKVQEQNFLQKQRMIESGTVKRETLKSNRDDSNASEVKSGTSGGTIFKDGGDANKASKSKKEKAGKKKSRKKKKSTTEDTKEMTPQKDKESETIEGVFAMAIVPEVEVKDLSHSNLQATRSQHRARTTTDGRRRRSEKARLESDNRNLEVNNIVLKSEYTGFIAGSQESLQSSMDRTDLAEASLQPNGVDNAKIEEGLTAESVNVGKSRSEGGTMTASADGEAQLKSAKADGGKSGKDKRQWISRINEKARTIKAADSKGKDSKKDKNSGRTMAKGNDSKKANGADGENSGYAGSRKGLKSRK